MTTIKELQSELLANVAEIEKRRARRRRTEKRLLGEAESLDITMARVDWNTLHPTAQMIYEHRRSSLLKRNEAYIENATREMKLEWEIINKMKSIIAGVQKQAATTPVKELQLVGREIV